MKSPLFSSTDYLAAQSKVRDLINGSPDFLSAQTAQSPRAAGDAIENIVADSFAEILGEHCGEYSTNFARRAMADIEIAKISERLSHFERAREFWLNKSDI